MEEYRLKIANMSKSFPGVKALDNIKLAVKPGSVHALIGENGAGKSTLMKCLFGLYHPDSGTIEIDGRVMDIKDPNDALKNGISMIHQELNPVPYRNVVDNIWAGRFQTKGIVVDENQMMEKTRNLLRDLDFDIDVTTFAKNLSVSQMQAIEIAKAVSYNAKIIIMDEPTSSLTVAETQHLFKIIDKLRKEGRSIIYISHKLEEIFEIADEITVMRDGQYIGTWDIKDITIDQLIGQMVGRKMDERFPVCGDVRTDEVMLRVGNVFGYIHTKKLSPSVDKVCTDLDVRMAGTKTLIKNLSGGNQQKVLIGRWLLANCDVIMLDEPTRGVDVGAKYEIYRIMQDLVKKGKAIIMVSSEMPELLGMSDRIMIMCAGKQTGILGKKEATQIEVMRYATQFDDKTKEGVSV